jgi:protein TonB
MVLANNAKSHANTLRVRRALYFSEAHMYRITIICLSVAIVSCKSTEPKPEPKFLQSISCLNAKDVEFSSASNFDDVLNTDDEKVSWDSKPLLLIEPKYPKDARKNKVEGYVKVSRIINEDGCNININVIESQPEGVFDASMLKAIKYWRYSPALVNGEPTKVKSTLRFDFKLPRTKEPESKLSLDLEKLVTEKM